MDGNKKCPRSISDCDRPSSIAIFRHAELKSQERYESVRNLSIPITKSKFLTLKQRENYPRKF